MRRTPPRLEQAEPLDERLGVEVAVPGRDRLAAEGLRRGPRRAGVERDRRGRGALGRKPGAVGDTPDVDARDGLEARQQALEQVHLVDPDRPHGRLEREPPPAEAGELRGVRRPEPFADRSEVLHGCQCAGDALEVLGPRLEPVVGRADLVALGRQPVEEGLLAVQHAEVRPVELVDGAGQEVRVEGLHVDRPVRRVVDRVDVGQGPDLVRAVDDRLHRVDRAHRVGGVADRHELRPRAECRLERLEVEGRVLGMDVHGLHDEPAIGGHRPPGSDVGLVVERRDDDLVARLQRRADRATDVERERRHVVAGLDLGGRAGVEEVGQRLVGLVDDLRRCGRSSRTRPRRWRWRSCSSRRPRRSPAEGPGCRRARRNRPRGGHRRRGRARGTHVGGHRRRRSSWVGPWYPVGCPGRMDPMTATRRRAWR